MSEMQIKSNSRYNSQTVQDLEYLHTSSNYSTDNAWTFEYIVFVRWPE